MRPPRDRPRGGFTLVELMVTLVITTILAAAIVAMLAHHRDFVRSQNADLIWSGQARAALTTLARDVREGEELTLRGDDGLDLGGVTYHLEPMPGGGEGKALIRLEGERRQVLASDVNRLRLARSPRKLDVTLEFRAAFGTIVGQSVHSTTVALVRAPGGEG